MQSLTKPIPVFWVLSLLFLAGCAHLDQEAGKVDGGLDHGVSYSRLGDKESSSEGASKRETDAVLRFIATAETGNKRFMRNEQTGGSGIISAGDFYHAASGHLCRYYSWSTSDPTSDAFLCTPSVACRDNTGDWFSARRIVNLDWLRKHMPACLQNTRASRLDFQGRLGPAPALVTRDVKPVLGNHTQKPNRIERFANAGFIPVEEQ